VLLGEEEEDWEAIERAHNRELLTRLVLQIAATCLTVWAAIPTPASTRTLTLSRDVLDDVHRAAWQMGFVLSLLWTRYKQMRQARPRVHVCSMAPPMAPLGGEKRLRRRDLAR
jgi:hypothetical protein